MLCGGHSITTTQVSVNANILELKAYHWIQDRIRIKQNNSASIEVKEGGGDSVYFIFKMTESGKYWDACTYTLLLNCDDTGLMARLTNPCIP